MLDSLDSTALFYRIFGETPSTFRRGTEVKATVTRVVEEYRILVRLDNGLQGSIEAEDFSDDPHAIRVASRILQPGDQLTCRVLSIDESAFRVRLSSRPSVVNDFSLHEGPLDPYFQSTPESWEEKFRAARRAELQREQRTRHLVQRTIFSPFYRCVDQEGAAAELAAQPIGSCLFRPSPQSLEHLILTVKVGITIEYTVAT